MGFNSGFKGLTGTEISVTMYKVYNLNIYFGLCFRRSLLNVTVFSSHSVTGFGPMGPHQVLYKNVKGILDLYKD